MHLYVSRDESSRTSWLGYSSLRSYKSMVRGDFNPASGSACMNLDSKATQATVINEILFGPSAFFAKLSIFLLYLRIFGPNKLFRYVTCAGIAIIFAFYTATTVMPAVLCIRRPSETWLESQVTPRCTRNSSPLAYSQGIFGVISNLFIYLLPLRVIWQLQMPLRRKIGVSAIFATGSL